jgi:hypothetical protein
VGSSGVIAPRYQTRTRLRRTERPRSFSDARRLCEARKVDAVVTPGDERILASLKWQQTGGTAEQRSRSRSYA